MQSGASICGVILINKQAGWSSHDVVARVRRLTGIKKVGHGGTLDPFATGLLLILTGKATKLFDLLTPLIKEYRATMQFGRVSDTGDITGDVKIAGGRISKEELLEVLPGFTGVIKQQAPAFSAVKVNGTPLYKKARQGIKVEPPTREAVIHRLELVSFNEEKQQAEIEVACSKGTYIRQLCEDIGAKLGSGALTAALQRTAIGDFGLEKAVTMDEVESLTPASIASETNPAFISCFGALYFLPVREVDSEEAQAIKYGQPIRGEEAELVRLLHLGQLLAVYGPADDAGKIKSKVMLL